jgi:hypothetical protein
MAVQEKLIAETTTTVDALYDNAVLLCERKNLAQTRDCRG